MSLHDIDVFQLHDASAFAELVQYEQVGIAARGEAIAAALDRRTGPRGDRPVNSDGGLLSRGHALGATALALLSELVHPMRGEAGERQPHLTCENTGTRQARPDVSTSPRSCPAA
ncbi:thiolase C-terminal domain-containing protein [Geodermatophilus africanus]|uniref:thiolase C-terminal domain-containing protein n=1 Tax=Geodermatophilus africanus TaxID=1137993 RepID=UPI000B82E292